MFQELAVSDLDIQFDLLADSRRQLALRVLDEHESPVTLRDLANEIVTREHDAALPNVPSSAVRDVHASLHHVHLPKLSDADVIDYDTTRNRVTGVDHDDLQPMLSLLPDDAPQQENSGMPADD